MRVRHAVTALLVIALGCTLSGEPDDIFYFYGLVTDPGGAPKPDASVVVNRTYAKGVGCPVSPYAWNEQFYREYVYDPDTFEPTVRLLTDAGTPYQPYTTAVTPNTSRIPRAPASR